MQRVSTVEQNLALQLDALRAAGRLKVGKTALYKDTRRSAALRQIRKRKFKLRSLLPYAAITFLQ